MKGLSQFDDLQDFGKNELKKVTNNIQNPALIPMLIKVVRFWILTPPFVFDTKSQKHLLAATHIILFYLTINRSLEVGNIAWNPIIQNFQEQWEAPEKRKEDNSPDVPKISKSLPVIKWVEAFEDYCHKAIEAWTIPLVYIIYNPYVFKLFAFVAVVIVYKTHLALPWCWQMHKQQTSLLMEHKLQS